MAKAPKTTTAPTGQIAPFGLRMLPELREKIEAAARESGRSMNAEVVSRLEESFTECGDSDKVALVLGHKLTRAEVEINFERLKNLAVLADALVASQTALDLIELLKRKSPTTKVNQKVAQEIQTIFERRRAEIDKLGPNPFESLEQKSQEVLDRHVKQSDLLMARMRAEIPLSEQEKLRIHEQFKDGSTSLSRGEFLEDLEHDQGDLRPQRITSPSKK